MTGDLAPAAPRQPRVLLLTFGTVGDVLPFITLAAALQERGHRTLLIAPCYHAPLLQRSGIDWLPYGTHDQVQAVLDDPALWHERQGLGVVWRGLLPCLDEVCAQLVAQASAGACAVLCHTFLVPVAAMARAQRPGLRIVGIYLAPSTLRTVHDPLTVGSLSVPAWSPQPLRRALWRAVDRIWVDPDMLPGLNAARAARALAPVTGFLAHMEAASDASLGLFPAWFARRQPDWPATFIEGDFPLRPVPAPPCLDADLAAFLAAGEPPVAFTPGTGHRQAAGHFRNALGALQALGRRGLFITPFADQLPQPLPPGVRWQPQAPFECLLPRLALLVHHGGIGTTAEALRAGVPQLILPFAFDQFDNGRRVQQLGRGLVLPAARANLRRLRRAMVQLLGPPGGPVAPGAGASAGMLAGPGLQRLVDRVEQAIGTGPAPPQGAGS